MQSMKICCCQLQVDHQQGRMEITKKLPQTKFKQYLVTIPKHLSTLRQIHRHVAVYRRHLPVVLQLLLLLLNCFIGHIHLLQSARKTTFIVHYKILYKAHFLRLTAYKYQATLALWVYYLLEPSLQTIPLYQEIVHFRLQLIFWATRRYLHKKWQRQWFNLILNNK